MLRFILANDLHLSHRGPVSRIDDWQAALFDKLDQIAKLAINQRVSAVLFAGDLFHQKSRIAYGTIYRLIDWCFTLRTHRVRVLAIPGNHDEVFDRYDSVPSQPVGVLFKSGAMEDVSFSTWVMPDGPEPLVSISGIPYPAALDLAEYDKIATSADAPFRILMAHCFATVEGGSYFGTPVHRYQDFLPLPYDVFHFGHDHSDHGVVSIEGKYFVNIGALSRGSLALDDVRREPKVVLAEFVKGQPIVMRQLRLKVKPASEVFDLALKAQRDQERTQIEEYVGRLSTDLALAGPVPIRERLDKMDLPDEIRARVVAYLDTAEGA